MYHISTTWKPHNFWCDQMSGKNELQRLWTVFQSEKELNFYEKNVHKYWFCFVSFEVHTFFCQKAEIFHVPFIFHFFKVKTNKYVQFWVIFKPNLGRKEKVLKFSFQCSMKSSMSFERSLCIAIYATRILTMYLWKGQDVCYHYPHCTATKIQPVQCTWEKICFWVSNWFVLGLSPVWVPVTVSGCCEQMLTHSFVSICCVRFYSNKKIFW